MAKLLSFFVLGALQIGSLHPHTNAPGLSLQKSQQGISNSGYGCACHCATDTAILRIWQPKDGPADRFAVKAIGRWFKELTKHFADPGATPPIPKPSQIDRTELLILLGRSIKGAWSLEAQMADNEGAIYADLVCTTIEGKREVFRVVKKFNIELQVATRAEAQGKTYLEILHELKPLGRILRSIESTLVSVVSLHLRQLAKRGHFDADSLVPVQLPLPSNPPALVFRPTGEPSSSSNWTVSLKARDGRLLPIRTQRTECWSPSAAQGALAASRTTRTARPGGF